MKKSISLLSPRAEHVVVACGSQITFFQKDDGYWEPCGKFICCSLGTIGHGDWSELNDIFELLMIPTCSILPKQTVMR